MSKKASRIFQEQALIEKTLLKSISEYRPTGDEDFDSLVRNHLLQDVHGRSVSFILSLYDIAWDMTFSEWQDFWFDMGIRIFDAEEEWHTALGLPLATKGTQEFTEITENDDWDTDLEDQDEYGLY